GPYASSAVGAVSLVRAAGSAAEHAALLPGMADGTTVGTVGLHEPRRRAQWRAPTTSARPDGDGWRLDGHKVHVADALAADLGVVTGSVPDGSLGVFAVDGGAPGMTVMATPTVDGSRKQGEIELRRTPGRRLGTGDASDAVSATVDRLHTAAVVDGVGAATR